MPRKDAASLSVPKSLQTRLRAMRPLLGTTDEQVLEKLATLAEPILKTLFPQPESIDSVKGFPAALPSDAAE